MGNEVSQLRRRGLADLGVCYSGTRVPHVDAAYAN